MLRLRISWSAGDPQQHIPVAWERGAKAPEDLSAELAPGSGYEFRTCTDPALVFPNDLRAVAVPADPERVSPGARPADVDVERLPLAVHDTPAHLRLLWFGLIGRLPRVRGPSNLSRAARGRLCLVRQVSREALLPRRGPGQLVAAFVPGVAGMPLDPLEDYVVLFDEDEKLLP